VHVSLRLCLSAFVSSHLCAEVLHGVGLDGVDAELRAGLHSSESARQEELLAATALLNDLDQTGLQLFDGRHVVRQHTHLAGFRGKVDLDAAEFPLVFVRGLRDVGRVSGDVHILGLVKRLCADIVSFSVVFHSFN